MIGEVHSVFACVRVFKMYMGHVRSKPLMKQFIVLFLYTTIKGNRQCSHYNLLKPHGWTPSTGRLFCFTTATCYFSSSTLARIWSRFELRTSLNLNLNWYLFVTPTHGSTLFERRLIRHNVWKVWDIIGPGKIRPSSDTIHEIPLQRISSDLTVWGHCVKSHVVYNVK